jgi:NADPH:quinone reductase-like Zn-dependent oxidoreductase
MNAAVIYSFDQPPRFESFAEPAAQEGEFLVQVRAAALHPVVKAMANGTHYGSSSQFPSIVGLDGAGRLQDGTRVYFGALRKPFGSMAELAVASKSFCIPIPDALEDETAAAILNPGMSSWLALKLRARLIAGETVLVLGATGAAGQLAIPLAKILGAKRVIAVGRNEEALKRLPGLGADEIISLHQADQDLIAAFRRSTAEGGIDIVLDYLWGRPAECLIHALSKKGLNNASPRVRFVQVGDSAGRTISLSGAALRSSGLELLGSGAGSVDLKRVAEELGLLLQEAAQRKLRVDLEVAPLSAVEEAWNRERRGRLVFQI